jgi:hypothetical protein
VRQVHRARMSKIEPLKWMCFSFNKKQKNWMCASDTFARSQKQTGLKPGNKKTIILSSRYPSSRFSGLRDLLTKPALSLSKVSLLLCTESHLLHSTLCFRNRPTAVPVPDHCRPWSAPLQASPSHRHCPVCLSDPAPPTTLRESSSMQSPTRRWARAPPARLVMVTRYSPSYENKEEEEAGGGGP